MVALMVKLKTPHPQLAENEKFFALLQLFLYMNATAQIVLPHSLHKTLHIRNHCHLYLKIYPFVF